MDKSGIGVAQIRPRTATVWRDRPHAPDRQTDGETHDDPPASENARSTPAPGLGQVVDKTV